MGELPGEPNMQNRQVSINWGQFNVPTIVSVLGIGYALITYSNKLDNRVENVEKTQSEIIATQKEMSNIPYRVGMLEGQFVQMIARQERIAETGNSNMELIRKELGAFAIKLEVVNQKLDTVVPSKRVEGPQSLRSIN